MQNNDKKYFIPVDGTPIEASEEVYRAYYQPIWNTRYWYAQNMFLYLSWLHLYKILLPHLFLFSDNLQQHYLMPIGSIGPNTIYNYMLHNTDMHQPSSYLSKIL